MIKRDDRKELMKVISGLMKVTRSCLTFSSQFRSLEDIITALELDSGIKLDLPTPHAWLFSIA